MNKIYHPCNLLCPSSSTHHQSRGKCGRTSYNKIQIYRPHFYSPHLKVQHNISWTFHSHHHFARHSINGSDSTVHGESDSQRYSAETKGSVERKDGQQERLLSTTKILEQLKRYGISGVLSYGLLNTIYYLTTFLLVWFYFAPAPGKMGYLAAVSRFLQVMAMVWAGSQVTKLIRAAGALALAPLVDRGLSWFTVRYKFESRGKAFFTIFAICISLAVIVFLVVTLLWA